MALVRVTSVTVLDNPSPFFNPFQFEITFECLAPLADDIEWKIIYVGSPESDQHDQVLDSILVGPVPVGVNKFVFQADPPDSSKIPADDAVGVTVVLLTCSYFGQEFVRIGYFVNNAYVDEQLKENPPMPPRFDLMQRNILHDKPRVTTYLLNWDSPNQPMPMPESLEGDVVEEDDDAMDDDVEQDDDDAMDDDDASDMEADAAP